MGKGSKERSNRKKLRKNYPECKYEGCGRMKQKGCAYCPTHAAVVVDEMIERTRNERNT